MTTEEDIKRSYQVCQSITLDHYENFPVASRLIPASLRPAVYAVYAFARTADDAADEESDKALGRQKITDMRRKLLSDDEISFETDSIFPALQDTIKQFDLPKSLFADLLDAFEYDLNHHIFNTWDDMLAYCSKSAVPVGRIILWLHNIRDEENDGYSNHITTALQLANFWQDISVDIHKNRIYIPRDILNRFHLTEDDFFIPGKADKKTELINFLVKETRQMFDKGKPLLRNLPFRLRHETRLTISGGIRILKMTEQMGEKVFSARPRLRKSDWFKILTGL